MMAYCALCSRVWNGNLKVSMVLASERLNECLNENTWNEL